MRVTELHGVRVETCERCQGHWLDSAELVRLAPGWKAHALQAALPHAPRRCPHARHRVPANKTHCGLCGAAVAGCPSCGEHLSQVNTKVCAVDVCAQCHGLWLDAGELQALRQHKQPITPMAAGAAMAAAAAATAVAVASTSGDPLQARANPAVSAVDVAEGVTEVALEAVSFEDVTDGASTAVEMASEVGSAVAEAVGTVLGSVLELFN
jgi:Zn-finger nucleic acid-binding protein